MTSIGHLARRCAGSLSRRPPGDDDERWAKGFMTPWEVALWRRMSNVDRRHAIVVARRFVALRPEASRDEMSGALLHDVGKIDSGLGTFGRVVATIVGPRTRRFRTYHDHEIIGATWLQQQGSSAVTVAVVRRQGPAAAALESADDL